MSNETPKKPAQPNLFALLKPYKWLVVALLGLAIATNGLNLVIPRLISFAIDAFSSGTFVLNVFMIQFLVIVAAVFVVTYGQGIMQVYVSERVARDLRERVVQKISRQTFAYVQIATPSKLLTNLTSDIDAIKMFVSQAIVSIVSSIVLIIGASTLLLSINWQLALATLVILPVIALAFFGIFSKVGELFKAAQGVVDSLNKIINESILGAALVRVLNAQAPQYDKFLVANSEAKNVGLKILRVFASVIPIITFVASMATIIVLAFGGHLVIQGSMTLGELAAFNGYLSMLIFPIFIIGFMSSAIGRAAASYGRVLEVLDAPEIETHGTQTGTLKGDIDVKDVSLVYGEKSVLKDVSFSIKAGTRNAIIGPTAAGKTLLLQILTGLTAPEKGVIQYDGAPIESYEKKSFHEQVGFVFQDSIVFNTSIRENIAFSETVSPENMEKAMKTAELGDFVDTLPEKLETLVSERGTSLSGGQKQRLMLARALALNPRILFLDDFTARVDANTEKRILENVRKNYPDLTLISVTQKISSVESYDQIVLLMEGEVLAKGTHAELMKSSPEYVQIAESQRTTNQYESHA
jgi:ATP-binding cassette subfamily B protein